MSPFGVQGLPDDEQLAFLVFLGGKNQRLSFCLVVRERVMVFFFFFFPGSFQIRKPDISLKEEPAKHCLHPPSRLPIHQACRNFMASKGFLRVHSSLPPCFFIIFSPPTEGFFLPLPSATCPRLVGIVSHLPFPFLPRSNGVPG